MIINGKDYGNKELDFTNILCDLEDIGIDIMGMSDNGDIKPFTLCRGIISVYTGEKDLTECGKILSAHLRNGGTFDDILNPFMEAMESAGFGGPAEKSTTTPQDHKEPAKAKGKKETTEQTE